MSAARTADDPTKAILSQSELHQKHLCDYVINVATGCRHGCRFCYVPATPNIRTRGGMLKEKADVDDGQAEWGDYVLYRDGSDVCPECGHGEPIEGLPEYECPECSETWPAPLADRLPGILDRKRTWKSTEKGQGIVGVSFHTDCFMDPRAGDITADVIETLADHGRYCRILTRNPMLAANYMDTFLEAGEYVTIGSSIPTLNEDHIRAIEPNAPPIQARLKGLQRFADAGVNVYVSMSPTYPTLDRADLQALLGRIAKLRPSVVFHEPINPRGDNYAMTVAAAEQAGCDDLAHALTDIQGPGAWLEYACRHFEAVQYTADDLDLPFHLWPDKKLVNIAPRRVAEWLADWRNRQSPEPFAGRPEPDLPALPPTDWPW